MKSEKKRLKLNVDSFSIYSHKKGLTQWSGFQTFNLLPHFLRCASSVSVSDKVERCRILEGWQHIQ